MMGKRQLAGGAIAGLVAFALTVPTQAAGAQADERQPTSVQVESVLNGVVTGILQGGPTANAFVVDSDGDRISGQVTFTAGNQTLCTATGSFLTTEHRCAYPATMLPAVLLAGGITATFHGTLLHQPSTAKGGIV